MYSKKYCAKPTLVNLFLTPAKIVITCNKRLSPYLAEEVKELGFMVQSTFSTGVETQGTLEDCIRLNLNLRCGSQVLYSLKTFRADKPDDVYMKLVAMPWESIIARDGYLTVTSTVDHFTVNNNLL